MPILEDIDGLPTKAYYALGRIMESVCVDYYQQVATSLITLGEQLSALPSNDKGQRFQGYFGSQADRLSGGFSFGTDQERSDDSRRGADSRRKYMSVIVGEGREFSVYCYDVITGPRDGYSCVHSYHGTSLALAIQEMKAWAQRMDGDMAAKLSEGLAASAAAVDIERVLEAALRNASHLQASDFLGSKQVLNMVQDAVSDMVGEMRSALQDNPFEVNAQDMLLKGKRRLQAAVKSEFASIKSDVTALEAPLEKRETVSVADILLSRSAIVPRF